MLLPDIFPMRCVIELLDPGIFFKILNVKYLRDCDSNYRIIF